MGSNPITIAQKLKEARESLKLTQEEVSSRIGLSRTAIAKIESGGRFVRSYELDELSKIYCENVEYFLDEDIENIWDKFTSILFRESNISASDISNVHSAISTCDEYLRLETSLEIKNIVNMPKWLLPIENKLDAVNQGIHIAQEERKRLNLGNDPIGTLEPYIENQGIRIIFRHLGEGISGFFIFDYQNSPWIFINSEDYDWRRNFDLAHEYAHILFDSEIEINVDFRGQFRKGRPKKKDLKEVRADVFASNFLVPEGGIKDFCNNLSIQKNDFSVHAISQLCNYFGVSYEVIIWRLYNIKMLSSDKKDELLRKSDLVKSAKTKPAQYRLIHLLTEAYRQYKISIGKMAEMLDQPITETIEYLKLNDVGQDSI